MDSSLAACRVARRSSIAGRSGARPQPPATKSSAASAGQAGKPCPNGPRRPTRLPGASANSAVVRLPTRRIVKDRRRGTSVAACAARDRERGLAVPEQRQHDELPGSRRRPAGVVGELQDEGPGVRRLRDDVHQAGRRRQVGDGLLRPHHATAPSSARTRRPPIAARTGHVAAPAADAADPPELAANASPNLCVQKRRTRSPGCGSGWCPEASRWKPSRRQLSQTRRRTAGVAAGLVRDGEARARRAQAGAAGAGEARGPRRCHSASATGGCRRGRRCARWRARSRDRARSWPAPASCARARLASSSRRARCSSMPASASARAPASLAISTTITRRRGGSGRGRSRSARTVPHRRRGRSRPGRRRGN